MALYVGILQIKLLQSADHAIGLWSTQSLCSSGVVYNLLLKQSALFTYAILIEQSKYLGHIYPIIEQSDIEVNEK